MSLKLQKIVFFIKIITNLVLVRPFDNEISNRSHNLEKQEDV